MNGASLPVSCSNLSTTILWGVGDYPPSREFEFLQREQKQERYPQSLGTNRHSRREVVA